MSSLGTFLHVLVLYLSNFNTVYSKENRPSVIIVGAGAAGIAAASKLFENGFKNITILEAENRIGGRIYTTRFDKYLVDLGGQWVHGEEGNIVFELANPFKLLEKENFMDGDFELFDSSGIRMDQTTANDLRDIFIKITNNRRKKVQKKNGSIGAYFENELYKTIKTNLRLGESKGLTHFFDMVQMEDDGGDTWWNVSERIVSEYPNPKEELPVMKNTILNTEVSLIYNDEKNGKVVVSTTAGNTFVADHVIVTVSLGVLKGKYNTLFKPPLPNEKIKTIKGLGFASEAKMFLSFDKPWWKSNKPGFHFFWNDEDRATIEKDPEKSWLLGFEKLRYVSHKPLILYGWISGKYSREIERLSDQQVYNHTVEVLQRFVGNYYNITMPTGIIRTMWNSNKYFKGTYTYLRTVKSEADNVWPATLAEPVGRIKPIILFAGEATSPHKFSTVHGAIETGFREANRLINLYPDLKTAN